MSEDPRENYSEAKSNEYFFFCRKSHKAEKTYEVVWRELRYNSNKVEFFTVLYIVGGSLVVTKRSSRIYDRECLSVEFVHY